MKQLKLILVLLMLNSFLYSSEEIPTQEEVAKLYVATFNRAPDSAGLTWWTNNSGLRLSQIAKSFFDQPETQAIYTPDTSNGDFVTSVYQNLFNRTPDTDGLNYWVHELDIGSFSKNSFIQAIINGAQNTATSNDADILTNKTTVGLSFSEAGLSNVDDARTIMAGISDDDTTMTSAVNSFGVPLHVVPILLNGVDISNSLKIIENAQEIVGNLIENKYIDYYTFTLKQKSTIEFDISPIVINSYQSSFVNLFIYSSDGNELLYVYGNEDINKYVLNLDSGKYYIKISTFENKNDLTKYRLLLNYTEGIVVPDDYSDIPTESYPIKLNSSTSGNLETLKDIDYFRFTLSQSTSITLSIKAIEGNTNNIDSGFLAYIYDNLNNQVEAVGIYHKYKPILLKAGTYYIKVKKIKKSDDDVYPGLIIGGVSGYQFILNEALYGLVTSPYTDEVWLDRNLGAQKVCTALDDEACYGDYYQWGRLTDGHEKSNSSLAKVQAYSLIDSGDKFITYKSSSIFNMDDWSLIDENGFYREKSWSLVDGNGICPNGFRVPTSTELEVELSFTTNSNEALNMFLKLPSSGLRDTSGGFDNVGKAGSLWSSNPGNGAFIDGSARVISYSIDSKDMGYAPRSQGRPVRCIKW